MDWHLKKKTSQRKTKQKKWRKVLRHRKKKNNFKLIFSLHLHKKKTTENCTSCETQSVIELFYYKIMWSVFTDRLLKCVMKISVCKRLHTPMYRTTDAEKKVFFLIENEDIIGKDAAEDDYDAHIKTTNPLGLGLCLFMRFLCHPSVSPFFPYIQFWRQKTSNHIILWYLNKH